MVSGIAEMQCRFQVLLPNYVLTSKGREMKVIFLDFDGVLNSSASFRMEHRRGNENVSDTLCWVNCSNFQKILEISEISEIFLSIVGLFILQ